ncbi:hypothetical protein DSAG12_04455 [Promethearchaeum syntrophicum]|uniref:Uncharacterized protein n=1 Tax=Promethearchaeum syntrophicum TaxID=2594042 RepID=A0AC61ZU27_9ARCH|nr:hypothetical protein [Candidatus Prometheoarchaeum syntrophicum]
MPEINIDFQTYLPTINTFRNYYEILRSHDYTSDQSMNALQSILKSKNLQRDS